MHRWPVLGLHLAGRFTLDARRAQKRLVFESFYEIMRILVFKSTIYPNDSSHIGCTTEILRSGFLDKTWVERFRGNF